MYINNCNINAIQNTQMIYNENEYLFYIQNTCQHAVYHTKHNNTFILNRITRVKLWLDIANHITRIHKFILQSEHPGFPDIWHIIFDESARLGWVQSIGRMPSSVHGY
jgi:hypothetical protein